MTAVRRRLIKPACVPACPRGLLPLFSSLFVLSLLLLQLLPSPSAALDQDVGDGGSESWSSQALRVTGSDVNISRAEEAGRAAAEAGKKRVRPGRYQRLQRKVEELEKQVRDISGVLAQMKKSMSSLVPSGKCSKGMCPIGSMKYGCDCLLYVHRNLTWPEAASYCSNMSGKLVTIYSKGIQKHIIAFLEAQLGKSGAQQHETYTGLIYTRDGVARPSYLVSSDTEISKSGSGDGWYWLLLNGSTAPLSQFHYWDHSQEELSDFRKSCMHLEGKKNFRWVTSHCHIAKHFICHFFAVPQRRRGRAKDDSAKRGLEDARESVIAPGRRGRRSGLSSKQRQSRGRKSKKQQENG